jgi:protein-ribulosamine 3-kinase
MVLSIPTAIAEEVERKTGGRLLKFSSTHGGCINQGGICQTSNGSFFLKWNDLAKFPGMFEAESKGLAILKRSGPLCVPEVICWGNADGFQFLVLENLQEGKRAKDYWANFGAGLARLHQRRATRFGLDHDNYIGSLPQVNKQSSSWTDFFREQRLQRLLKLACDAGIVDHALSKKFDRLFHKLGELLPEENPSLLHGDLWGGNIMIANNGQPCLIDPAVYFGSREMDLAMTQLFGGFNNSFFHDYENVYPLVPGYTKRVDLYNLYPLLVHVNLFGGGYVRQVMTVLERFI